MPFRFFGPLPAWYRIRGVHTHAVPNRDVSDDDSMRMEQTSVWLNNWSPTYDGLTINQKAAVDAAVFVRVVERLGRVGLQTAPATDENVLGLPCTCDMCALYVHYLAVLIAGELFTPVHADEVHSSDTNEEL